MAQPSIYDSVRQAQTRSLAASVAKKELRFVLEDHEEIDTSALAKEVQQTIRVGAIVEQLFPDDDPELRRFALLRIPGIDFNELPLSPFDLAHQLEDDLGLKKVEPDLATNFHPEPESAIAGCWVDKQPPSDKTWALKAMRVDKAWALSQAQGRPARGQGVRIGQPDTGVAEHVELLDALDLSLGYDFVDDDPFPNDPLEDRFGPDNPGHGTGTASVAVSRGGITPGSDSEGQITGSAPAAKLVPIRAIRSVVVMEGSRVAQAIDHARRKGCHVVTMSLGGIPSRAVQAALQRAVEENVIVLAAAGNCVGTVVWPAAYQDCIAVGGTNIQDQAWPGTCRGSEVTVSAPAEHVWRAERQRPSDGTTKIAAGEGTSFAVALTAGVAALWLAHHGRDALIGSLRGDETLQQRFRRLLRQTARRPAGWDESSLGAGIVDAEALLKANVTAVGPEATLEAAEDSRSDLEILRDTIVRLDARSAAPEAGPEAAAAVALDDAMLERHGQELIWLALSRRMRELPRKGMAGVESAAGPAPEPSQRLREALADAGMKAGHGPEGFSTRSAAGPSGELAARAAARRGVIVIDPGHGGTATVGGSSPNNATGPAGTLEKDVTLAIGLKLADVLKVQHDVRLTRSTDINLGLAERAKVARDARAHVFVSIHLNGWHVPTVQGTETLVHTRHSSTSRQLATRLQAAVRSVTNLRDRGVKAQELGVLNPARHDPTTAACLCEVSFLTDPAEEQRLRDGGYQTRIARAMAQAIDDHLSTLPARPELAPAAEAAMAARITPELDELEDELEHGRVDVETPEVYPAVPSPGFITPPGEVSAGPPMADLVGSGIDDAGRFHGAFKAARMAMAVGPGPEITVGSDNKLPFSFLLKGAVLGRSVCRIQAFGVNYQGRSGNWSGTGFLVAPNILLTNHHVVNSIEVARQATAVFDFAADADDKPMPVREYKLDPTRLFVTSPFELSPGKRGLDYTFVWIELDETGLRDYRPIKLQRASFLVERGDRANIIHHPHGQPKHVSLQDNVVVGIDQTKTVVHYTTDTEPGSSGCPVFTNDWRLFALHHSSEYNRDGHNPLRDPSPPPLINEGIRIAAIAVDLEQRRAGDDAAHARRALQAFTGTDSALGYFGTLGRREEARSGVEAVTSAYEGEAKDVDIAFWNIEWFSNGYAHKLDEVGAIIADLNLDIWALSESSPEATRALVEHLRQRWGLDFDCAFSEPDAPAGRQTTTVIWNRKTIDGGRVDWPDEIDAWFKVDSRDFGELRLEAVHGKVFNRYPGLFRFTAKQRDTVSGAPFDFWLVPLHLKAKAEGDLRRRQAARILAAAMRKMMERGEDADWVIGGDLNAELASGAFDALRDEQFVPLSADDEQEHAFSYLKGPRSLIDHIFLSPNLASLYGADDFFIVARELHDLSFIEKISDHRPVLVRLSLLDEQPAEAERLPSGLLEALKPLGGPRYSIGQPRYRQAAEEPGTYEPEDSPEPRRRPPAADKPRPPRQR